MSYKALYNYCQNLEPKISTNNIRAKILELTKVPVINTRKTTLDISVCRGFYLSSNNLNHPFVKQHGSHVIVLARGMNKCWDRFIYTKELMHLFDDPLEATDRGDELLNLLTDLQQQPSTLSPQVLSEINCIWMALGVLCPEKKRKEYTKARQERLIDDYGIALELRIPQQYVPLLFQEVYQSTVNNILNKVNLNQVKTKAVS